MRRHHHQWLDRFSLASNEHQPPHSENDRQGRLTRQPRPHLHPRQRDPTHHSSRFATIGQPARGRRSQTQEQASQGGRGEVRRTWRTQGWWKRRSQRSRWPPWRWTWPRQRFLDARIIICARNDKALERVDLRVASRSSRSGSNDRVQRKHRDGTKSIVAPLAYVT